MVMNATLPATLGVFLGSVHARVSRQSFPPLPGIDPSSFIDLVAHVANPFFSMARNNRRIEGLSQECRAKGGGRQALFVRLPWNATVGN